MTTQPAHLHALNHPGHAEVDLDPVALAHAILADPQVAASALSLLRWSHVLGRIALHGGAARSAVFEAGEVSPPSPAPSAAAEKPSANRQVTEGGRFFSAGPARGLQATD